MRLPRLTAAALALTLALSGCNRLQPTPSPTAPTSAPSRVEPPRGEPAADGLAQQLARGLVTGDLAPLDFIGDPSSAEREAIADYTMLMAGMDGLRPRTVTPKPIAYQGNGVATVQLDQAWTIGGKPWTFTSSAHLNLVDGTWRVAWGPEIVHPQATETLRLRHTRTLPPRALITDRDGLALAEEQNVRQVGIDKANLARAKWADSAKKLAAALKVDAADLQRRVNASGPQAFVIARTVRENQLPPSVLGIEGVKALPTTRVDPITPGFATALLGTMGEATAEQAKSSKGLIEVGDPIGVSGLQARYDAQLRGVPGHEVTLVPRKGAPADEVEITAFSLDPKPGTALTLTLKASLQQKAEKVLAGVKPVASLVAINTTTGEVVVAANSPASNANPDATFGRYAPGSTFKVVTALALLRRGMSAQSMVDCPATATVNGRVFKNYSDYPADKLGRITLTDAIAYSCNTAFVLQAKNLPKDALAQAAGSLGVGIDFDAGFPVFYGSVPSTDDPVVAAANTIGQGQIEASPLAMAGVAASVNARQTRVPWLIKGRRPVGKAAPLTPAEADHLRTMMQATVTKGSGRTLQGLVTGAKTGTAEFGTGNPPKTHAWIITYHGDLAIAVMVAEGASGSQTAAPLVKAFLS